MKSIGITSRLLSNSSYPEVREALDVRWGAFLQKAELMPVMLPIYFTAVDLFFNNLNLSGLILTGGNDLSALSDDSLSLTRDVFEKKLLFFAIKKSIPILGICRGAQLIADNFGSIFSQTKKHVSVQHLLSIDNSARYACLLRGLECVNSYHNYTITKIFKPLKALAFAEDGSIEALEHEKLPILGIMWHPEREQVFKKKDLNLFQNFFN